MALGEDVDFVTHVRESWRTNPHSSNFTPSSEEQFVKWDEFFFLRSHFAHFSFTAAYWWCCCCLRWWFCFPWPQGVYPGRPQHNIVLLRREAEKSEHFSLYDIVWIKLNEIGWRKRERKVFNASRRRCRESKLYFLPFKVRWRRVGDDSECRRCYVEKAQFSPAQGARLNYLSCRMRWKKEGREREDEEKRLEKFGIFFFYWIWISFILCCLLRSHLQFERNSRRGERWKSFHVN